MKQFRNHDTILTFAIQSVYAGRISLTKKQYQIALNRAVEKMDLFRSVNWDEMCKSFVSIINQLELEGE